MTSFILLPGLNGDLRIFDQLAPRLTSCTVVAWIEPRYREPFSSYVKRLSASIPGSDDEVVVGVSFGGIIARELAVQRGAKGCAHISSVRDHNNLPKSIRGLRLVTPLVTELTLSAFGTLASFSPFRRDYWARIGQALRGEKGAWRRWAVSSLLRWKANPQSEAIPLLQIHGDRDATIPISKRPLVLVIPGGGHLIAFTHAEEIALEIRRFAESL